MKAKSMITAFKISKAEEENALPVVEVDEVRTEPCPRCGMQRNIGEPHNPEFCIDALQAALVERTREVQFWKDVAKRVTATAEPLLSLVYDIRGSL